MANADTPMTASGDDDTITLQVWVGEHLTSLDVDAQLIQCMRNKVNEQWPEEERPQTDDRLVEAVITSALESLFVELSDDWRHA